MRKSMALSQNQRKELNERENMREKGHTQFSIPSLQIFLVIDCYTERVLGEKARMCQERWNENPESYI